MDETWGNPLDQSPTMWNHCKVEQAERVKQACFGVGVWSQWRHHLKSLGQSGEHIATKSSLLRHLLNLKVLPTSKALKLYIALSFYFLCFFLFFLAQIEYIALSSTSMTDCFALMFKWKLDKCMMNCHHPLRRSSETSTNWHLMWSIKKLCIRNKKTVEPWSSVLYYERLQL